MLAEFKRNAVSTVAFGAGLLALCSVVFFSILHMRQARLVKPPESFVGTVVRDFTIRSNQGTYSLKTAQKPLVLEVFATWCENCQAEVGTLDALYAKHRSKFDFLAVTGSARAVDGRSRADYQDVLRFAARYKVKYPIAFDASRTIAKQLGVVAFPAFFVIGKYHKVEYQIYGRVPFSQLDGVLRDAGEAHGIGVSRRDTPMHRPDGG